MADRSDEDWERIAKAWREAANLDDAVRFDAPSFVKWLKHNGHIRNYVCLPYMDSEGRYEPSEETVYYPEATWNAALAGNPRANWTLVHEACHAIHGHAETRLRNTAQKQKQFASHQVIMDETDTNRLTAAIIAPFEKSDFKPGTSATDLMARFGLSRIAAERRLVEFERMYRRKHGIKRDLPPGVADFLLAQKKKNYKVTSIADTELLPIRPIKKYEGDACPNPKCKQFKLYRVGLCMKCEACGAVTGED